ncbi:MAG: cell division protein FtsZ [Patescibacteria group bacterium]|nr:cell division protein FtsZ [Patescibacteria group bacterium]
MKEKNIATRELKPDVETFAKIKVVGIGGSGGSAINRMIDRIRGVEFIAVNTDAQALNRSSADKRIQIGIDTTRGLGAGMDPEVGAKSAEENLEEIEKSLEGADMVFITCGLGGGTGTGAAPIIADIARRNNSLTVAVVTKPFTFEGSQRKMIAERGLNELENKVDTIITIPNDRILNIIDRKTSVLDSFRIADEILHQGIQGISEIITIPGEVNVDFADVKRIMSDAGSALMGIGRATGEDRAKRAAKEAINSPLLDVSISGAKGILFTITGGEDLTMYEINEIAEIITSSADGGANIIFGTVIDKTMNGEVKVMVVATGFENFELQKKDIAKMNSNYRQNQYISRMNANIKDSSEIIEDKDEVEFEDDQTLNLDKDNDISATDQSDDYNDIETTDSSEIMDQNSEYDIPAFLRKKIK